MDNGRILPPAPRIPSAANPARIPDPALLEPHSAAAAKVARQMRAVYDTAHAATTDLVESRPDGKRWRDIEDEAVKADDPSLLAAHSADEPTRDATAVVRARRAVAEQDDLRQAGKRALDSAAAKIRTAIADLVVAFEAAAHAAWEDRDTTPGYVALDEATRLHQQIAELQALAAWCDGTDTAFVGTRGNPAPPEALGAYIVARSRRDGKPLLELPPGALPPRDWEPSKRAFVHGAS